jgi:hypothetical protein
MRSGLLIICSCDHLKLYTSQGSADVSIYRKSQKIPKTKFVFPVNICLWSNKEVGTKVVLHVETKQSLDW